MSFGILWRRTALALLSLVVLGALFGSGFLFGYKQGALKPETVIVQGITNATSTENVDFGTFWQAWHLIDENYLRYKDLKNDLRVQGAINGLMESTKDPYSIYLPPSDNQKFQEDIQGSFGGVGMEIGIRKDILVVVSPIQDTPAMRAGLKSGDQILKVNSSSTDGLSVDQAVKLIRGPVGTTVTLSVYREGWDKPKDFSIERATISAPTLDYDIKDGMGHIRLYSFNANASEKFFQAITALKEKGMKGLVLDMRNNPGGFLEVAVDLAGWFVPRGTLVVKEEYRSGSSDEFKAQGNGSLATMPVVVLVNQGSASAAEILAGALRDERKAKIIGEQTFGKGTVQQLFDLRDGSSLKLTVAHWVMPSGQILDGMGIKPDIEVKVDDTDLPEGKDPQLEKAFEVLKSEIIK